MRKQSLLATPLGTESILGELSEDMTKPKPIKDADKGSIENWEEALPQIVIDVVGWRDGMGVEWTANMLKKWVRKILKQEIARVGEEIIGEDTNPNLDQYRGIQNNLRHEQRKHLQEILKAL